VSLLPADLAAGATVYLLEIEWGGQLVRAAEKTLDSAPFGIDSAKVQFEGALDVAPGSRSLDLFRVAPDDRSIACTLHLTGLADVPDLISQKHLLQGAPARLYLHAEGSTRRLLVLAGLIDGLEFGEKTEPVTFSVTQSISEDLGSTHPAAQFIGVPAFGADGSTWNYDSDFAGEYLPLVFGKPGDGAGTAFGSPAFGLNNVPGGTISAGVAAHPIAATSVYIENFDNSQTGTLSTMQGYRDVRGRRIALVDLQTWSAPRWSPGDEMWLDWGASAGGVVDAGGNLIRGAGDVIAYLLRRSSTDVDWGRLLPVLPLLNAYKIDTAIVRAPDAPVRPWEWLASHVLPLLPVSVVTGPEGLSLAMWRYDATSQDAVAHLEAGVNCYRSSAVAVSGIDRVHNEIEILYGVDAKTNQPTKRKVLTGHDQTLNDDSDAAASHHLRISSDRYGRRPRKPIRADAVWEDATASRVLRWMARRDAMPSESVAYDLSEEMGWLPPGSIVTLTDRGLSWSSRLALVEDVSHADGRPAVALVLHTA